MNNFVRTPIIVIIIGIATSYYYVILETTLPAGECRYVIFLMWYFYKILLQMTSEHVYKNLVIINHTNAVQNPANHNRLKFRSRLFISSPRIHNYSFFMILYFSSVYLAILPYIITSFFPTPFNKQHSPASYHWSHIPVKPISLTLHLHIYNLQT